MKNLLDFYNDSAELWANNWYNNETLLPYLKRLLSYLPINPRVLDLCCGAGYESMRLLRLGASVVGIDISEKELKIAKERNPELEFYNKNILNSYKDLGEFDGLVCIAGLVHIEENDLKKAFKNMDEVLKDNGYMLIVVRDGDEIKETSEYNGEIYARKFISYTLEKLKEHSKKYFKFVENIESIDKWKYYIFKKINKNI